MEKEKAQHMNIREKLEETVTVGFLESELPHDQVNEDIEELLYLFKQWALEMVGEDDTIDDYDDGGLNISEIFKEAGVELVNATKQEIRERIEESTK